MVASPASQRVLLGALIALVAAIGAVVVIRASRTTSAPRAADAAQMHGLVGPLLPAGLRAADFTLPDQDGRPVTMSRYRGHVVVVTFIHSLCRDTCPYMVEQIKGALNALPSGGRDVAAIGVSVHPREDTVASRRAFLVKHEMTGRMRYVNGSIAALTPVWRAYAMQPATGQGLVHSSYVLLIDKAGIERVGFPADQLTPEQLAHDIRVLQRERA
jgi:protein SCO1/2